MATDGRSAEERDAFVSSLRDTVPVVEEVAVDRTAAMKAAIVAAGGEVVG